MSTDADFATVVRILDAQKTPDLLHRLGREIERRKVDHVMRGCMPGQEKLISTTVSMAKFWLDNDTRRLDLLLNTIESNREQLRRAGVGEDVIASMTSYKDEVRELYQRIAARS